MASYHPEKTPASNALTDLIRAVLRMGAGAQKIGKGLTKGMGLSNARWQTLGELNAATAPMTVSQVARRMGLTRQAVQRLADGMHADGLVQFVANPKDRRAMHVVMTEQGKRTYRDSLDREWRFTNAVAEGFTEAELADAARLIDAVARAMDENA